MLRNTINYTDTHSWKIQLRVALMLCMGTILIIMYGNLGIPVYIHVVMPLPILLRPFILKIRYPGYSMTSISNVKGFVKDELDILEAKYEELEFRRTRNNKVRLVTIKSKDIQRTKEIVEALNSNSVISNEITDEMISNSIRKWRITTFVSSLIAISMVILFIAITF